MRRGRVPELGLLLLGYQLVKTIGLGLLPPVTFVAILIQVAIYLQFLVVPRLCISGDSVWYQGDILRLVVPVLRHSHDIHLYYNMVSLAWKGISLEKRLGSIRYLLTLILLVFMSSLAYVGLALVGADLLDDPSIMQQCAIGFSGVLFALKVLACHYDYSENEHSSYFGFLVPMKYAVWIELLIIQIAVPNSSFMGHLAGILVGLVLLKFPILRLWLPASASPPPLVPSSSTQGNRNRVGGFGYPICIILCALQVCLFFSLLPQEIVNSSFAGCLPTRQYMITPIHRISMSKILHMMRAPFHHLSIFHLALNLVSFLVKSRYLEPHFGCLQYISSVAVSLVGSSFSYILLGRLWMEVTGSADHLSHCVVGISGALFALKVLTLANVDFLSLTFLFEIAELAILMEKNSRLYHAAGLLAGVFMLLLLRWSRGPRWGVGQRVGGNGRGTNQSEHSKPPWTRSWGYSGQTGESAQPEQTDDSLKEALERSRQTYAAEQERLFQPSAPLEEAEHEMREPVYPSTDNLPPPPGPGYRIRETASRSLTQDELRRRRLERFA